MIGSGLIGLDGCFICFPHMQIRSRAVGLCVFRTGHLEKLQVISAVPNV